MSIFHKVTLEILKKNKMRTIVTIIGIILSASMFTAVTTTVSSVQNYLLQNAIYNHGDWHVAAMEVDNTFFDFLQNPSSVLETPEEQAYFENGNVESYVYNQQLGYAVAEGCMNEDKPYLYIIGADADFCEKMPVHLTGGRLPEKSSEILLPEHLAENGEVYHKVGDVLTLEIGNRMTDGYILGQHNPYMNTEVGLSDPEGHTNVYVSAVFVEDRVYDEFLKEYKLDKSVYANPEKPLGIAIDGNTFFDYSIGKYITTNVLKEAKGEVTFKENEKFATLQIGAIVEEAPFFVNDIYELPIVYPYSLKEEVLQEIDEMFYWCDYYIVSDDHKGSFKDLKSILVEQGLSKNFLYDYAEGVEENRTLILIINVFAYGFIALISLIAAANVFNTVSTNISLRRREFAMLKSVGMSNKELQSMMNFECILYGSRALLYGLPVSIVITWFIYRIVSEGFTTGFYLPWKAICIAVLSVFLVVFATMMYSMKKIQKDNPMDALKNEK